MSKKSNLKDLKIDEKKELSSQAGMANVSGSSIMEEMLSDLPDEEVSKEVKDKNPYQFKYEVKLKKVPKKLKAVVGIKEGKIGRVIEVIDDKSVVVDFWDTKPARFPVKNRYLELLRTKEQVEKDAGIVSDEPKKQTVSQGTAKKYNEGKPRLDLIRPEFSMALGDVLGYGAEKYGEKKGEIPNYLRGEGLNYSDLIGSLERHIAEFKMGVKQDHESGRHPLVHAAANVMFLLTYELTNSGKDDRIILEDKK